MKPNGQPVIPIDEESERLILGSILASAGTAMDGLRSTMEPSDFGSERHRRIWLAACSQYDDGGTVDYVSLHQAIKAKYGGNGEDLSYLIGLNEYPNLPSLDRHIDRLKDQAMVRRIAEIAGNLQQRALAGMENGEELREALEKSITDLSESVAVERRPISSREMLDGGVTELLNPHIVEGVRLPWDRLNKALHGFRGGQNIILAAETGRGKTSAALQISTHALRQGKSVLYWTMEMPPAALFRRMVTQITGYDTRDPTPCFDQREREREAMGLLYDTPIYFDRHSRTVPAFCSSLRQVRRKTRLGLVVVDYLQLIRASGRAESRTREVGENSRALKLATMDFDLPFLVLSQFARLKDGVAPTIHSLKESGDTENDADVILLFTGGELSRDAPTPVSVKIGKQREGPAGFDVPLIFQPTSQSFESVEES